MHTMNLTNQYISESFHSLLQISSSGIVTDGTGSIVNILNVTASSATTASYISPAFINSVVSVSGAFATTLASNTFSGSLFPAGPYSGSISTYSIGSPSASWKNVFAESIYLVSGSKSASINLSGSNFIFDGGISIPTNQAFFGYLQGTASNAVNSTNAVTASYALTASFIVNAISSSFATTASFARNSVTASYVLNAISSSFAQTASYINPLFISASAAAYGFGSGGGGGSSAWIVDGTRLYTDSYYNTEATGSLTVVYNDNTGDDIFIVKHYDGTMLFKVTKERATFPVTDLPGPPSNYGQLHFTTNALYVSLD